MPGEFYDKDKLIKDRDSFQRQKDAITLQTSELEAESDKLDENIAAIDSLLLFIEAGYPDVIVQLDPTGTFNLYSGVREAVLDWEDVADAEAYIVERAFNPDYSDAIEIYNDVASTWIDEDLAVGTIYYYRVKATATGKADSEWVNGQVTILEQLATPANLVLVPEDTAISGDWDIVPFATAYDVYRHTANDFGASALIGTVADTNFSHTGLVNGTPYFFWIIATAVGFVDSEFVTDTETPAP
jgi:hypothetical protein